MKSYLLYRLAESSTWRGLILFLTALGITISPSLAECITAAGLAIVGLINILRKEPSSEDSKPPFPQFNDIPPRGLD